MASVMASQSSCELVEVNASRTKLTASVEQSGEALFHPGPGPQGFSLVSDTGRMDEDQLSLPRTIKQLP
jgi:hypothetical protein